MVKRKSRRKSKSRRRSYKCKYGMLKRSVRDKKTGRMRNCKKGPRKSKRKSRRKSVKKRKSRRKSVRKRKSRRKSVRKRKSRRKSVKKRKSRRKSVRKNRRGHVTTRSMKRKLESDSKNNMSQHKKINTGNGKNLHWVLRHLIKSKFVNLKELRNDTKSKTIVDDIRSKNKLQFPFDNLEFKFKGNFDLGKIDKIDTNKINELRSVKEDLIKHRGEIPENFKNRFTPIILKASNENYRILKEEGLLSLMFPVYCTNGYEESEEAKEKLIQFIKNGDYTAALRFLGWPVSMKQKDEYKILTEMQTIKDTNCFIFYQKQTKIQKNTLYSFPYIVDAGDDLTQELVMKLEELVEGGETETDKIKLKDEIFDLIKNGLEYENEAPKFYLQKI